MTLKENWSRILGLPSARLLALALWFLVVFLGAQGFVKSSTPPNWSIVASPDRVLESYLDAVTCVSESDCWAVGNSRDNFAKGKTLFEHWDGTKWSIVPSPSNDSVYNNDLTGIACPSVTDCWAVGSFDGPGVLIEHWDGTSWTIAPSPAQPAVLSGVACASASDCWAVGSSGGPNNSTTLIEHWDGAAWSVVSSPNQFSISQGGAAGNYLSSVACASASECFAVGNYYAANVVGLKNTFQTLIEKWDGTSWTIVNSPNNTANGIVPGTTTLLDNLLNGVTCNATSDCWAVGTFYTTNSGPRALAVRWDGVAWSIVPSSNLGTRRDVLTSVSCASGTDCWAAGVASNNDVDHDPLMEHWDGSSWNVVSVPAKGTNVNALAGVTCGPTSDCWTVGHFLDAGNTGHTLIEETTLTVPPLSSVVSRMNHVSAGTFDIDLPLIGARGVECRSGGPEGNYQLVFTFVNNVTSCGTATIGSVSAGPGFNQCTVSLTGIANQQYLAVRLGNVIDAQTNTGNIAATMGLLIGDVNGDGRVGDNDVSAVQSHMRQNLNNTNFRYDVNVDGMIGGNDLSLTHRETGTSLPSAP